MSVMEERFEELERRLAESDQAGGPDKISKQHQAGKMTAASGSWNFWTTAPLKRWTNSWHTAALISAWPRPRYRVKVW